MSLVRSGKMHSSAERGVIAGNVQGMNECGNMRGKRLFIVEYARPGGQQPGQRGHAAWNTEREGAIRRVERGRLACKPVQMRSPHVWISKSADDLCIMLIGKDENDVRMFFHGMRGSLRLNDPVNRSMEIKCRNRFLFISHGMVT